MTPTRFLQSDDLPVPCYDFHTVIVGSGAAGLNAAEHLRELLGPEASLAVVTSLLGGGASHCSGSDKQTYWRLGAVEGCADSPRSMAETIAAGGCMHGDHALAEAEGALPEFCHLVRNGVPFPQTALGSFVGYRTDHDPLPRATSAGPWTSRFMVQCSLQRVRQLGIPIFSSCQVVGLVAAGSPEMPYCAGIVAVDRKRRHDPDFGLTVFAAQNVIMATGGPGELYADSVYPPSQMGAHGVCFEAGLTAHNLTESQFGLASLHPRWNLSGTYQQVLPRYYSTGPEGEDARDFLAEVFPEESARLLAIFRKGYQWPFQPGLAAPPGSSAIDLLVARERAAGRRVWLDFRNNPVPRLSLETLPEEARDYLLKSGATGATPGERLEQMNPDALDLYRQRGVDLATQPLEIAVCAQHNNGGFAVDSWWESSLPRLFIIGEQAGTHGVTRPGGAALNSGQVGGLRAAQRIARFYGNSSPREETALDETVQSLLERLRRYAQLGRTASASRRETRDWIQRQMSAYAGPLREVEALPQACVALQQRWETLRGEGLQLRGPYEAPGALEVEHLALAGWAYLEALRAYVEAGGGSRGSYLVLDPTQPPLHPAFPELRVRADDPAFRGQVQEIAFREGSWQSRFVPCRPLPEQDTWFENVWRDYRTGRVWK